MYEHKKQPLISFRKYLRRQLLHLLAAFGVIVASLLVGILCYHLLEGLNWVDSLLNASMILGGMGPVNGMQTNAGKIFASIYALYSGIVFLVVAGVIFAPIFHRVLHHFHLEVEEKNKKNDG